MNILVITSEFPSGGKPNRASFNRQHLAALAKIHRLHLVCPIPWQDYLRSDNRADDFSVPASVKIDAQVDYVPYFYPPCILRGTYAAWMWLSLRGRLKKIARTFSPDIVLGIWAYPDGGVALKLGQQIKVPCVVQVLGSDVNLLDEYPEKRARTLEVLAGADRVVSVSQALRDRLICYGIEGDKVKVVYRGVNADLFQPRDRLQAHRELNIAKGKRHILFVGNLVSVKNPRLLLHAFLRAELNAETELHFLGNGPLRSDLEAESKGAGTGKNVVFHGSVSHQEIATWMAAVDLLVLSSDAEGVPNVLFEARSVGCPYLATNVGGVPEISAHKGASLVPPGDLNCMRRALETYISAPEPAREPVPWQSWSDAGRNLAMVLEGTPGLRPVPACITHKD